MTRLRLSEQKPRRVQPEEYRIVGSAKTQGARTGIQPVGDWSEDCIKVTYFTRRQSSHTLHCTTFSTDLYCTPLSSHTDFPQLLPSEARPLQSFFSYVDVPCYLDSERILSPDVPHYISFSLSVSLNLCSFSLSTSLYVTLSFPLYPRLYLSRQSLSIPLSLNASYSRPLSLYIHWFLSPLVYI